MKVELDAVGTGYKFLKEESLSKKVFKKVDFYGTAMRIITLKQLEDIYSVAYNRSKDDKEKIMERIKRLEKSMGRKMKWSQVQNDKKLHDYYNKHVANKKFYRVFSSEYKKDIKVHGLTSKRNPYKKKYNDIKKLFKILLWLEKTQNFNHTQNWGKIVTAEKIVRTSLNDMKKKYIDFTPHLHEVKYYKKLINKKGGALVSATKLISDDILKRKPKLPSWANYTFINSMKKWAQQKGKHPFMVLYVKGSSKSFEKATYQIALGKGPKVPSPLGSFEHFKKVVNKYGLKKFKATLEADPRKEVTKKTHLNVRVTKSVSKEDIHIV